MSRNGSFQARLWRVPVFGIVCYTAWLSLRLVLGMDRSDSKEARTLAPLVLTETAGSHSAEAEPPADARFELRISHASIPARLLMGLGASVFSFLVGDANTFGGRRADVIDRSSGVIRASFVEPWRTDDYTEFSRMLRSHRTDSAGRYEERWLANPTPGLRRA